MDGLNGPGDGTTAEAALLAAAKSGDREALQRLIEPHRRELQVHCYRMLGSYHDAEDLVQETFLRAWRGLRTFEGRSSMRHWLYRIATNACLNALASRRAARRVLPETLGPATDQLPAREPASDIAWLEPYPDAALEGIPDRAPGPDVRYETREAVHMAFVAAIQLLPPRQRVVLLMQDVLGWPAADIAGLLGTSAAAVNSALQRARATLESQLPHGVPPAGVDIEDRALLDRYVRAWESTDVERFTALLKEDATMSMPPWREWYRGRQAIGMFFAHAVRPGGHAPFRLLRLAANGQPAYAFYSRWQAPEWRFHSIQLLTLSDGRIETMTSFVTPDLANVFGLPAVLDEGG